MTKNLLFTEEDEEDDGYQNLNEQKVNQNLGSAYNPPTMANTDSDGFGIFDNGSSNHNSYQNNIPPQ